MKPFLRLAGVLPLIATVTLVDVAGTYIAEMAPGAKERHSSPNFRLRAAVIETANGPYFIKLTGPVKTIASHDKAFEQFLSSVNTNPEHAPRKRQVGLERRSR